MPAIAAAQVLEEALALSLPERSYIAERLLVSLDDAGELSAAELDELDQRVQRRQSGESHAYSREEVHQQIQSILD